MSDSSSEIQENTPDHSFKKSLLNLAENIQSKADQETSLTHGQFLISIGAEAILGAVFMANALQGGTIDSYDALKQLALNANPENFTSLSWPGKPGYINVGSFGETGVSLGAPFEAPMSLKGFLEMLINSKVIDNVSNKPFVPEASQMADLAKSLNQLSKIQNDTLLIYGCATCVMAGFMISETRKKLDKKVLVSSHLLPAISKIITSTAKRMK